MVRLILSKHGNIKDQVEIFIDVLENATANKWIKLLKQNLQYPIKKHVMSHGWIMDSTRTVTHIVREINEVVAQINEYSFVKRAWELQNNKVKKDFKIDLEISKDTLIKDKDFNTDIVNQLHDKFVQLEGAKTLDNIQSITPYFEISPPEIRWKISKINNLAHELFHWGEEYKRWHRVGYYNPEIHVHYYNVENYSTYDNDDSNAFDTKYTFGQIHLGDPTVGKLYWDAFNDSDDHIDNTELECPKFIIPDFHVYFGNTTTDEENILALKEYKDWLAFRNLSDHEPANKMLGKPVVAMCDFNRSVGANSQAEVCEKLNEYSNVYALIVDEKKATYEWTMEQQEIDIEQHA